MQLIASTTGPYGHVSVPARNRPPPQGMRIKQVGGHVMPNCSM